MGDAKKPRPPPRYDLRKKRERHAAVDLLVTWFFEMRTDLYDDEYDCTCEGRDACPLHRLSNFLRAIGVRGLPRIPSARRLLRGEAP